jgi:hypothetical protein
MNLTNWSLVMLFLIIATPRLTQEMAVTFTLTTPIEPFSCALVMIAKCFWLIYDHLVVVAAILFVQVQ